jgi:hypothetical protein
MQFYCIIINYFVSTLETWLTNGGSFLQNKEPFICINTMLWKVQYYWVCSQSFSCQQVTARKAIITYVFAFVPIILPPSMQAIIYVLYKRIKIMFEPNTSRKYKKPNLLVKKNWNYSILTKHVPLNRY